MAPQRTWLESTARPRNPAGMRANPLERARCILQRGAPPRARRSPQVKMASSHSASSSHRAVPARQPRATLQNAVGALRAHVMPSERGRRGVPHRCPAYSRRHHRIPCHFYNRWRWWASRAAAASPVASLAEQRPFTQRAPDAQSTRVRHSTPSPEHATAMRERAPATATSTVRTRIRRPTDTRALRQRA